MSAKIAVLGLVIEEPGPAHRLTAKLRQRLSSAGFVDSNVYSALTRLERDGLVRAIDEEADDPRSEIEGRRPAGVAPGRSLALAPRAPYRTTPRRGDVVPLQTVAGARRIEAGRGAESAKAPDSGERVALGIQPGGSRLARAGVRRSPGSRVDSRSFEATPAGVQHFEEWLLGSSTAPPLRDELHMKVALCQPRNLPRLVELVYGQELVCLARVRDLKRSLERVRPPAPERWSGLVQVHIRDAELSFWEARLRWLQGVRESLEGMHSEYERAIRRRSEA
jgi:hypothetical protein